MLRGKMGSIDSKGHYGPERSLLRRSIRYCAGSRSVRGAFAILSKWSLPTRLETRTKESKTHASMVVEKPACAMKVIDAKATAASTVPQMSESVILRTRKMVNYA